MPSEAAILAICAAVEAVCSVVKLAIEGQPPEVRAQFWKWYVEDAERWRRLWGLDGNPK